MVRSNHTYKLGGELKVEGYPVHGNSNTTGTYVFSPAQTGEPFQQTAVNGANVGFGYASFLLGLVQSANIARPVFPKLGKHQIGLFVQDTWKVTRKLTMDYGLRYDYSTYLREQYGRAPFFSRTAPNPTVGNIPGALIFDGNGAGHCKCALEHNYTWAFRPRLTRLPGQLEDRLPRWLWDCLQRYGTRQWLCADTGRRH
jgi:outer membrane receptor protein involved in Fe transport